MALGQQEDELGPLVSVLYYLPATTDDWDEKWLVFDVRNTWV